MITNPGVSLVEPSRFIDAPPLSRNEKIAAFLRRANICEERGSGIDKVIAAIERSQLPPLEIVTTPHHTKVTLYAYKEFSQLNGKEKVEACYQHACLCHESGMQMTNASLRQRFSIAEQNYSVASRIIADAIRAGRIKSYDPESSSKRHAKYLPYWS